MEDYAAIITKLDALAQELALLRQGVDQINSKIEELENETRPLVIQGKAAIEDFMAKGPLGMLASLRG